MNMTFICSLLVFNPISDRLLLPHPDKKTFMPKSPSLVNGKGRSVACINIRYECKSIHSSMLAFSFKACRGLVPISSSNWARGSLHSGQVTGPSQVNRYIQDKNQAFIFRAFQFSVMLMDCRRKTE